MPVSVIVRGVEARSAVGRIASAAETCRVAAVETATHSAEGQEVMTAPGLATPALADLLACPGVGVTSAEVAVVSVAAVVVGVADKQVGENRRAKDTGMTFFKLKLAAILVSLCAGLCSTALADSTPQPAATPGGKSFPTPQKAAEALVTAADNFDVPALIAIFGPHGKSIVLTGEVAQDREHAGNFAAEAREKLKVAVDPHAGNRAFILVGKEDWPFPVPLVKSSQGWIFDAKAGETELMYRRIGSNELDAIQICLGYVEAQEDYALQTRPLYQVNQYAQRIVSTPGKQDGLAWQNSDGSWGGPIGEKIAQAIDQGYTLRSDPYHGYFFKILKGQGPAAPLGEMNYVVQGVMIGGFALVAAPAEYGVTGVNTFLVSQDGVVYQKDFGPNSLDEFKKMELFNPDASWIPVAEKYEADNQQSGGNHD